jgi:acetoin utilization deacetylase AcuC-like enzyme
MRKAGFLIDDRFRRHRTGSLHLESPSRLDSIQHAINAAGVNERWRRLEARPAREDQLEWIHSRAHIEHVKQAAERAPAFLDPDTPVSAFSYDTALLAAGSVLACIDAVWDGSIDRAFAFVRPPGHHAEPGRAMGFCLFNNVALGAAYLRSEYRLNRIAIVDFDVHHGNGTQACFYAEPAVLFISTHQFPYYPGSGHFSEIGIQDGWGYTLNFPLPAGTGDAVFAPLYARIVAPVLDQFQPQFILVSAGFDAHRDDPLGGLEVSAAGFASTAASLLRAADRCCSGKICFVLEGGYSQNGLQECLCAVMAEMESENPMESTFPQDALFEAISRQAEGEFGERWQW